MQHLKNKYFEEGYLHLPNFLNSAEIDEIRAEAKQVFINQMIRLGLISGSVNETEFEHALYKMFETDLQAFINCGKHIQHLISLHRLSLDHKIVQLLNDIGIKSPVISTRPVLFFNSRYLAKKEVYWKTPPHQDWRSIQGSINAVVIWIPLIDIDVELGAVEIIPKSHLEGLITKETVDSFGVISNEFNKDDLFVPMEVKKGDIVLFSQFLIHRSGNNSSDSIRWSCHFRYNDLDEESFIDRKYPHTYIYKPDDTLIHPEFDTLDGVKNYFNG
ncbi:MAG: phytanoyl-CoA dioxygenase [Flavobacteriaceae bacterium]|nr:phytanoyl-CoA dioxygenase [Flavobacteriaceae bacterium]